MPILRSKQETDTMNDVELRKEKLSGLELAQEEANSLLNMVHSENVRLSSIV